MSKFANGCSFLQSVGVILFVELGHLSAVIILLRLQPLHMLLYVLAPRDGFICEVLVLLVSGLVQLSLLVEDPWVFQDHPRYIKPLLCVLGSG